MLISIRTFVREVPALSAPSAQLMAVCGPVAGRIVGAASEREPGRVRARRPAGGSFLASLALALGMVELAGRRRGRLDAVFLDEGFGGLDTSRLDAAIDALETRATHGRLAAVVSHVQLVAERITNVLGVRATSAGSEVSWLSTAERSGPRRSTRSWPPPSRLACFASRGLPPDAEA